MDSILFKCFESELVDKKPVYDFKLRNGISKERIGMLIIEKENIIGLLNEIIEQRKTEQKHSEAENIIDL